MFLRLLILLQLEYVNVDILSDWSVNKQKLSKQTGAVIFMKKNIYLLNDKGLKCVFAHTVSFIPKQLFKID